MDGFSADDKDFAAVYLSNAVNIVASLLMVSLSVASLYFDYMLLAGLSFAIFVGFLAIRVTSAVKGYHERQFWLQLLLFNIGIILAITLGPAFRSEIYLLFALNALVVPLFSSIKISLLISCVIFIQFLVQNLVLVQASIPSIVIDGIILWSCSGFGILLLKIKNDLLVCAKQMQDKHVNTMKMMTSEMIHDVNTPLGICISLSSNLRYEVNHLERKFNNKLKRSDIEHYFNIVNACHDQLNKNLYRIADLTESMRTTNFQEGLTGIKQIRLADYIESLVFALNTKIEQKSCTFKLECSSDLIIYSIPNDLGRVLTNLIMNSLVHAFEGRENGEILIKVDTKHDEVLINYSDNGVGIRAENLDRVFMPFYTTKGDSGGTGLGMHIIKNIVSKQLRGSVTLNSEEGQGVQIGIRLPRQLTA